MTGSNFMWAWGLYLLACLLFWLANWRLTKTFPIWFKVPFLSVMAVAIFVPARVAEENQEMAPAWLVLLFDALIQEDADIWRSAKPLMVFGIAGFVLSVIAAIWFSRRAKASTVEQAADQPA